LRDFRKLMKKPVFSWEEARVVAFSTSPGQLKLQLHMWKTASEIISLRRGVYTFADSKPSIAEIASALYSPCAISLEYALNLHGLLPDIPFGITLVTTRQTRKFNTAFGQFSYQKIKKEAFVGFDPKTLLAEREKALVDYLYLNRNRMRTDVDFLHEMRWQHLETIRFARARKFAGMFGFKKLTLLLDALEAYAKSCSSR
ncbi:MAG: hypothetical protein WC840_04165, partial [Candidatus Peribacteraceae bacterium]